jgi:hypothetical protein
VRWPIFADRSTPTSARSKPHWTVTIGRRGGTFTLAGTQAGTSRAAQALRRFYGDAEKPLSIDDIQLGLIELSAQQGAATSVAVDDEEPMLRTRRADLHGRTPNQTGLSQGYSGTRHHLRHRTGGHRQNLSCRRLRSRRTRAR